MEQLLKKVKKELSEIGEKELTTANVEIAGKLVDIVKDIGEIKEQEKKEGSSEMRYEEGYGRQGGGYNGEYGEYGEYGAYGRQGGGRGGRGGYNGEYGRQGGGYNGEYGRQGQGGGGGYNGEYGRRGGGRYGHDKLAECLDRIADGKDMYEYDRSRYRGDDQRVLEGLEKMMYGVCMFVESAMDFAETPEEKEIVRKHIRKLENI